MLRRALAKLREFSPNRTNSMRGINNYGNELADSDIDKGMHRECVGGMWEEMGKLQFNYMLKNGLKPNHRLLDVGCGALRAGIHFIEHLEIGNYYGVDVNESLIRAGAKEVAMKGIGHKMPNLLVNDSFKVGLFGTTFDFVLSVSVFTHLYMNHIVMCMDEVRRCMKDESLFYATFYEAPTSAHVEHIKHMPSQKVTKYDQNPFHYSYDEISMMAHIAGMKARYIGNWNHPRDQIMVEFSRQNK